LCVCTCLCANLFVVVAAFFLLRRMVNKQKSRYCLAARPSFAGRTTLTRSPPNNGSTSSALPTLNHTATDRYWRAVNAAANAANTPIKYFSFVGRYHRWCDNNPYATGQQHCNTHIYILNHTYCMCVGDDRGKNRAIFTPDQENELATLNPLSMAARPSPPLPLW
jgi:hypothetical protein